MRAALSLSLSASGGRPRPSLAALASTEPNFCSLVGSTLPSTFTGTALTGATAVALTDGVTDYACLYTIASPTQGTITRFPTSIPAGVYSLKVTTPGGSVSLASAYEAGDLSLILDAGYVILNVPNGSTVSLATDLSGTGDDYSMSTAGNQPPFTLNDASWNGKPSIALASGKRLVSASKTASKPLSNGTGGGVAIPIKVVTSTSFGEQFGCIRGTFGNVGVVIVCGYPAANNLTYIVANGSSPVVIATIASAPAGTRVFWSSFYKTGASPNCSVWDGTTQVASAAQTGTPSAADWSQFPSIGAADNGADPADMTFPQAIRFGNISSTLRTRIANYQIARFT